MYEVVETFLALRIGLVVSYSPQSGNLKLPSFSCCLDNHSCMSDIIFGSSVKPASIASWKVSSPHDVSQGCTSWSPGNHTIPLPGSLFPFTRYISSCCMPWVQICSYFRS